MAQYCRYCSWLCYGDVPYCEFKGVRSEESCKRTNKCKEFELNEIDAFGENEKGYVPRKQTEEKVVDINQMTLEFIEEEV